MFQVRISCNEVYGRLIIIKEFNCQTILSQNKQDLNKQRADGPEPVTGQECGLQAAPQALQATHRPGPGAMVLLSSTSQSLSLGPMEERPGQTVAPVRQPGADPGEPHPGPVAAAARPETQPAARPA